MLLKKIINNNFIAALRIILNIKSLLYLEPSNNSASVSDFFYWQCNEQFDTKFILTNISSHILPNFTQDDEVKLIIYNDKGHILKEIDFNLSPFETKEIIFSKFDIKGFGSFFVFHKFKNIDELIRQKCFISERGYVGYQYEKKVWNFVHGNHNACYLNDNLEIKSIIPKSFFENTYIPQVSFYDTEEFKIIFNNPLNSQISFNVKCFDKNDNILESKKVEIEKFNTSVLIFKNVYADYVQIHSKLFLCRPLIYKTYGSYFDIFHG